MARIYKRRIEYANGKSRLFVDISIGSWCRDCFDCPCRDKCKYGDSLRNKVIYRLNKFIHLVTYHIPYNLRIPVITLYRSARKMSGTDHCPFKLSRNYTCYECIHACGPLLRNCDCSERNLSKYDDRKIINDPIWGEKCGYFDKCSWADDEDILDG